MTKNTVATITATSVADPTKTAKATVTISTATDPAVSLELLSPPTGSHEPYYDDVQKYLLNNPVLAGVNFFLEWGSVDRGLGANPRYDFSAFDKQIAPWIAAGKRVNVIVWAVSDDVTNTATPQQMNNLGPSNITTCAGEEIPNYFQAAFQLPYQDFQAHAVSHFSGNGSIGYIRFGLGRGGETFPARDFGADPCTNTFIKQWGWSDTNWLNYVTAMLNHEATLPSPKQLMVGITGLPNQTISVPPAEAAAAVSLHIGFGNQGFSSSDIANFPVCASNWCDLFAQYGKVPLELQTFGLRLVAGI